MSVPLVCIAMGLGLHALNTESNEHRDIEKRYLCLVCEQSLRSASPAILNSISIGGDVHPENMRTNCHRDLPLQEIPTFHAQPQTPACDNWCPFPVADRPNAVRQFFEAASQRPGLILAPWILLIETDYVWMKPLHGVPAAESAAPGWAFSYGYIMPTYPCALCSNPAASLLRAAVYHLASAHNWCTVPLRGIATFLCTQVMRFKYLVNASTKMRLSIYMPHPYTALPLVQRSRE